MKPLTKAVRSAHAEGRDWRKFLYQFLLNYRATPHSTTGVTPAQLLFKERADRRVHCQRAIIGIGDTVLVRQQKKDKFTMKFDPAPYKVTEVKGTMVTVVRNEKSVTRNVSHFKRIQSFVKTPYVEDSDLSDDEPSGNAEKEPRDNLLPTQPQSSQQGQSSARYPARQRKRCQRYGHNVYDY